jgi:hypothetical protein
MEPSHTQGEPHLAACHRALRVPLEQPRVAAAASSSELVASRRRSVWEGHGVKFR